MLLLAAPRGEKGLGYLPFVCVLVWCVTGVVGHGGSNIKEGSRCVPWLCSCFYRGVYYDDGDIWSDVEDPCTKYQCKHNGYFEAVETGCSFKGECKLRGSTWFEGCIQYTCPDDLRIHGYRLQQAACVWKDGNCYAVGQQAAEHCDIYECQLDHGCYVMNLVKSGCKVSRPDSVKAECKPMYSFWQDECSMYQCVGEEKDELKARVLIHSHDVMSWPRGHYALPEPMSKCPELEKGIWMEGSYSHCGDGCNFKSKPFDLLGSYNETIFQHKFCVHHDVDDPELIPLYQTYWEPGRYCILRYNGTCPRDFSEGYLEMTNNQCFPNQTLENLKMAGLNMTDFNMTDYNMTDFNITDGRLPDGNFTVEKTRLEFCCRYDGEIERAIILPAKHPFVLFMAANETECQSVQGMRVEKEFWSFCDTEDGEFREMNGSLPLIKTGDNNTMVNFCFYSPFGCGCTDDDDNMFAIGENKTEDCVTTQCRNIEDHNVMVVTKGGCWDEIHERCRAENATWDDTRGEMCVVRKCVRITQPEDQLNVTFKIIDIEKGCRDGADCRPVNYTKEKGCYASQCQLDMMGDASFVLTRSGCAVGKDVCIPDQANHTIGCITLECDKTKSSCGLHVIKAGCRDLKGECINVDSVVTHHCTDWTCKEFKKDGKLSWKLVPLSHGCADSKGNCYEEGDTLNAGCITYECVYGDRPGFYPMSTGCKVTLNDQIRCIYLNETTDYHCNKLRCIEKDGKKQIIKDPPGCSMNGKCYKEGENVTIEGKCLTYECSSTGRMQVVEAGCNYKGTCYPPNENFTIGCVTFMCNYNRTNIWTSFIQKACKVDGECIDPGTVYKRGCSTYKCSEDKKSCHSVVLERGCSMDGKCYKKGDNVTIEEKCLTYECSSNGSMDVVKAGCNYNGTCYPANENFTIGCTTLMCNFNGKKIWTSFVQKGCSLDGKCYKKGENVTMKDKCLTYECSDEGRMEVVQAGCNYKGTCYPANKNFTIGCTTLMCNFNGTNIWTSFIQKGCSLDGKCYKKGENVTMKDKCLTYECSDEGRMEVVQAGCNYNGTCYPADKNFTVGCTTLMCNFNGQKIWTSLIQKGCSLDGKCYKKGENVTMKDKCLTYGCSDEGRMEVVQAGCNYNGTCYPANKNFTTGCNTLMCNFNGTKIWTSFVQKACKVDGKCIDPGTVFKYHCHTYKCSGDKKSCHSVLLEKGCSMNGKCYEKGENVTNDAKCLTYGCSSTGRMQVVKAGCNLEGTCHPANEKFTTGCSTYRCNFNGTNIWTSLVEKGCMEADKCIPFGTQRVSKAHSFYCKTQQCHHGKFYTVKNQCKTADNTCIDMTADGTTYNLMHGDKQCTGLCKSGGIVNVKC